MTRTAHRWMTSGLILGALLAFAGTQPAHAQTKDFNVPAQSATTGIPEFARQAGIQILVSEPLVRGKRIAAITGSHSVQEALAILLKGTGLSARSKDGVTYTVTAAPPAPTSRNSNADEGQASSPSTVEKQDEQASKKKTAQLEEVIVTGSRIPTAAGQQTLPVLSYTREDMERAGQGTITEYLNTLPSVSTFNPGFFSSGLVGVQPVQLHGLPAGTTLTLLDGLRLQQSALGFFDVGNIPASAVDRMEILPVGASSIYGADALGGAVNFILRKNFDGFEINASLDHAPGVNNPGINAAWGKSWERGSLSLITSYDERGELLGDQRQPWSLTQPPASWTAAQVSALASTSCAPGNVYSVDGTNLPGLSSPFAATPTGISGKPTISQFVPTAGKQNYCNSDQYVDVVPRSNRESVLLSAHYELADAADLFTQVLFSQNHEEVRTGASVVASASFGGTLAATNPYNPFGEAVNVSFEDPTSLQNPDQSLSFFQPTIGVRGDFLSDWHYEATVSFSRDSLHFFKTYADSQAISNALASADPATALNPFTTGRSGTTQLIGSLTNPAVDFVDSRYDDRATRAQALVRGPLFRLPAGTVQSVLGVEAGREKQDSFFAGNGFVIPSSLQRKTYAAFSEARIPLLAGGARVQGGEHLALTFAGRYDHSDDYGGKASWQGGVQWRATDVLFLSGGYGKSYAAPQLSQISGPQAIFAGPLGVADPFRGNQLIDYSVNQVAGPNFNLKPETGDSANLKVAYSSDSRTGLRASVTWYVINISNYIGVPTAQALVDNPGAYPEAVVRAPPTSQDQQLGYLGQITQINETAYNFGDLHVAGFDVDMSYAIETPLGQFTPSVTISNIYKWQSALTPNTPTIDGVSQATINGVGWAPRWNGTAALAWKHGSLSTNVAGRYIGRYRDYQDYVANNNEIGNTWIFDASARYELGEALFAATPRLAHSYISLAAVNVFNKVPPLSFTGAWYDYQEYDIRGRYLRLIVGLRF
jgi:iron complex outermembrane receptor protein